MIDADFKDGGLGWDLAAFKTVNVDLPAVWAGGGTGQRLQFVLQFVGIVGERVEIAAIDDRGAYVANRRGQDSRLMKARASAS